MDLSLIHILGLSLLPAAERARAEAERLAKAETQATVVSEGEPNTEAEALALARIEARKAKDWARADELREALKAMGCLLYTSFAHKFFEQRKFHRIKQGYAARHEPFRKFIQHCGIQALVVFMRTHTVAKR